MRITYPNAYRLWASLHRENPHRLFLATQKGFKIGDRVPVDLGLPGRDEALHLDVEVVERRGPGGRFAPGVVVQLTPADYLACRKYLGIGPVKDAPAPTRGEPAAGARGRRVIVGDDDADILGFLNRALSRFNVEIIGVRDGESALKLIKELRPSLAVLDVMMPGLDGSEVCRLMRCSEDLAGIPVVLVSALDQDELDAVADKAGANDCMAKPMDLGQLLNIVGEYLRT